jgi:hypothetical protein
VMNSASVPRAISASLTSCAIDFWSDVNPGVPGGLSAIRNYRREWRFMAANRSGVIVEPLTEHVPYV